MPELWGTELEVQGIQENPRTKLQAISLSRLRLLSKGKVCPRDRERKKAIRHSNIKRFISDIFPKYLWLLLAFLALDLVRAELNRQHTTTITAIAIEMKYLEMAEFRFSVEYPPVKDLET